MASPKKDYIPAPLWYKAEPPKSFWKRFLMAVMGSLTSFFGVAPVTQGQLPQFLRPLSYRVRTTEASGETAAAAGAAPAVSATALQRDVERQIALAREEAGSASITSTEYEVKIGDSLSKIAQGFYGNMNHWPVIYVMNQNQIKNPNVIYPGQKLIVPLPAAGEKQFSRENVIEATAAAAALQGVKEAVTPENAEQIAFQISTRDLGTTLKGSIKSSTLKAAPLAFKTVKPAEVFAQIAQVGNISAVIDRAASLVRDSAEVSRTAAQEITGTPGASPDIVKQANTIAYINSALESFVNDAAKNMPADEERQLEVAGQVLAAAEMSKVEAAKIADLALSINPASETARKAKEIGQAKINIVASPAPSDDTSASFPATAIAAHYENFTQMAEQNPALVAGLYAIGLIAGLPGTLLNATITLELGFEKTMSIIGQTISGLTHALSVAITGLQPPSLENVPQITPEERQAMIDEVERTVKENVAALSNMQAAAVSVDESFEADRVARENAALGAEYGAVPSDENPTTEAAAEVSFDTSIGTPAAQQTEETVTGPATPAPDEPSPETMEAAQIAESAIQAAEQEAEDSRSRTAAVEAAQRAAAAYEAEQARAAEYGTVAVSPEDLESMTQESVSLGEAASRMGGSNPGITGAEAGMLGGGYTTGEGLTGKSPTGVSARGPEGFGISLGERAAREAAAAFEATAAKVAAEAETQQKAAEFNAAQVAEAVAQAQAEAAEAAEKTARALGDVEAQLGDLADKTSISGLVAPGTPDYGIGEEAASGLTGGGQQGPGPSSDDPGGPGAPGQGPAGPGGREGAGDDTGGGKDSGTGGQGTGGGAAGGSEGSGEGADCFKAGTLVVTAVKSNGEFIFKNIEDIRKDEDVMGIIFDKTGRPILQKSRVVKFFQHQSPNYSFLKVETKSGVKIVATKNHPMIVDAKNNGVAIERLADRQSVVSAFSNPQWDVVTKIEFVVQEGASTFNIKTLTSNYLVSQDGKGWILAHNKI